MLSTIGYESARLEEFIDTLKAAEIDTLIDVRERAQSRRKGFSKTALSEALALADIEYRHFPKLGDPKEGRDAARSGDWKEFRRIYSNVIRRKAAVEALDAIIEIMRTSTICLLCYEKDANTCHRKIIADKIEGIEGIEATHLLVRKVEPSSSSKRRMLHTREGSAASV